MVYFLKEKITTPCRPSFAVSHSIIFLSLAGGDISRKKKLLKKQVIFILMKFNCGELMIVLNRS
jgi:hypothetical protein